MKKNISIWIVLWSIVGAVAICTVFNEKRSKDKNEESTLYAGKGYDINGGRCISFEQMKYIARKKMTSNEIDVFSQKCGLILKKDNTDKDDWSSEYGFDNFHYYVTIIDNDKNFIYSFYCRDNIAYVNRLHSDLKEEDSSATEGQKRISSHNIEGFLDVSMNWVADDNAILVSIMVEK